MQRSYSSQVKTTLPPSKGVASASSIGTSGFDEIVCGYFMEHLSYLDSPRVPKQQPEVLFRRAVKMRCYVPEIHETGNFAAQMKTSEPSLRGIQRSAHADARNRDRPPVIVTCVNAC